MKSKKSTTQTKTAPKATPAPKAKVTLHQLPNGDVVATPVVETPAPVAPPVVATPAPVAPSAPVMGVPDLTSRRIAPGTPQTAWRLVANQRKNVEAKYYVQCGATRPDPETGRDFFAVAIEIPFTDHYAAKVELVARRRAAKEVAA